MSVPLNKILKIETKILDKNFYLKYTNTCL